MSRYDHDITQDIAKKCELFGYQSAEDIWEEIRKLAPNFAGVTYERIDKEGGLQWPCPDETFPIRQARMS